MMSMIFLFCAPIFFGTVSPMYSNKAMEGYPSGYLAECPGSTKPAIITDKSLKYLTITVIGANTSVPQMRKKYSYFQMKDMSKDPTMDYSKRTLMYVGGFLDSPTFPLARTLEIYYRRLGYNVWLLDVNRFTTMEYPTSTRATRAVGRNVGDMLVKLTSLNVGFDPKKLNLLGFSLGGQTISFIAKRYKAKTGVKIDKITALDPLGICFRRLGPDDRLDSEDADFVEVILTNIDVYGMPAPVGHVNFYVNGGEFQASEVNWTACDEFCSHMRAYSLWLAALENPHGFIAVKCNSVQEARESNCFDNKPRVTNTMGMRVDRSKPGIYYLSTTNLFPYFVGLRGLKKGSDTFTVLSGNVNLEDVAVV